MQVAQNEIRTTPRPRCFLCNVDGQPLYQDLVDSFFGAPGTWACKQCPNANCGLIWLDPCPIPEDLHLAYQRYFTHGEADGKITTAGKVREWLYRGYQAASIIPYALTGLGKSKREAEYMFLQDLPPGKVLDVGCGDGIFLERMRRVGWSVDGIDTDAKAVENGRTRRGLQLHHGDLESVRFPENSFDAVTLSHVIEHLPKPLAALEEIRRILKPRGRLVLTTPNSSSYGHQEFRGAWLGLDPPRHLQVFSLSSLEELARRAYLKVVSVSSTAARADIFIGGSLSIRSARDGRTHHQPRPNPLRTLKAMWGQYTEHFSLASQPERGEEAVLVARKA